MEHKKFLKLEEMISDYTDDEEATRRLALEIVDFLEKPDFNFGLDFGAGRDVSGLYTPRENVCINNPSTGAS